MVVVLGWIWLAALLEKPEQINPVQQSLRGQATGLIRHLIRAGLPAAWRTMQQVRLLEVTIAMLAVAAPWYIAVGLRTDWAWPAGFFFVHNVGRFVAPMERHSGGLLFHPLTMLVGFYPWSCFLPLAVVVAGGRLWRSWRIGMAVSADSPSLRCYGLMLFWMAVWVGGFSLAATKLPNYILPAYPAAAVLVAALAVEAARQPSWPFPRWLALGIGGLAFGGIATAATVLIATFFGLTGGECAAAVGLVPLAGAGWLAWSARLRPIRAVVTMAAIGLVYSSLAVGPAAGWISRANTLPGLLDEAHAHAGGTARIGVFPQLTPNIVYYARGVVAQWQPDQTAAAAAFLASGSDAVVIVPEDHFAELAADLPRGTGVIGRTRPLFKNRDFLLVGNTDPTVEASPRTATAGSLTR
jgi:4-amino-4-deoxy-L-arabinose transferase-like glycosyltransferase